MITKDDAEMERERCSTPRARGTSESCILRLREESRCVAARQRGFSSSLLLQVGLLPFEEPAQYST